MSSKVEVAHHFTARWTSGDSELRNPARAQNGLAAGRVGPLRNGTIGLMWACPLRAMLSSKSQGSPRSLVRLPTCPKCSSQMAGATKSLGLLPSPGRPVADPAGLLLAPRCLTRRFGNGPPAANSFYSIACTGIASKSRASSIRPRTGA